MGFDIIDGGVLTLPWTRERVAMQARSGAPWIGTMDDPVGFLAARGWKADLSPAGEADANHGRWPFPVIPRTPGLPHDWFVVAEKQSDAAANQVQGAASKCARTQPPEEAS